MMWVNGNEWGSTRLKWLLHSMHTQQREALHRQLHTRRATVCDWRIRQCWQVLAGVSYLFTVMHVSPCMPHTLTTYMYVCMGQAAGNQMLQPHRATPSRACDGLHGVRKPAW